MFDQMGEGTFWKTLKWFLVTFEQGNQHGATNFHLKVYSTFHGQEGSLKTHAHAQMVSVVLMSRVMCQTYVSHNFNLDKNWT